jgi:hypothetical protein
VGYRGVNALQFKLPKDADLRARTLDRARIALDRLPEGKTWLVTVSELKPRRSEQQNRYLFGVCYAELLKVLPGWEVEDVHTYMLGECFGWERIEGMGKVRNRPLRRSSGLNKQEFSDFIEFVQRKAAEHGVVIPEAEAA